MPARRLAVIAVVLALATIGWAQLSGPHAGTYSLRALAVLAAWLVGSLIGRRFAWLVAVLVMVAVALSFALSPGSLSGRALAPPLHYGNADGAFAAAGVAAGTLLLALPVSRALRVLGAVAAFGFLGVCVATQSKAAFAAALVTFAVGAAAVFAGPRWRRAMMFAAPVVVGMAFVFTLAVGASFERGARVQPAVVHLADQALSERRAALWHDALVIVREHPVAGVGPGGFATASPTARADADARWAHSVWLQQASDQGIVGLVLLVGAVGAGWWLVMRRRFDAVAVAGSWALGALLVQASIDYVVDFVAVPVVVAALAGAATSSVPHFRVIAKEKCRHSGTFVSRSLS